MPFRCLCHPQSARADPVEAAPAGAGRSDLLSHLAVTQATLSQRDINYRSATVAPVHTKGEASPGIHTTPYASTYQSPQKWRRVRRNRGRPWAKLVRIRCGTAIDLSRVPI
ncbi:Hypothetical Protein RSKD131_1664 [Cereibacter sphaeroides KD131]|nr:Hypothetical Protein RSKD131_1664 [Cereibacter sphaeroides KD131]